MTGQSAAGHSPPSSSRAPPSGLQSAALPSAAAGGRRAGEGAESVRPGRRIRPDPLRWDRLPSANGQSPPPPVETTPFGRASPADRAAVRRLLQSVHGMASSAGRRGLLRTVRAARVRHRRPADARHSRRRPPAAGRVTFRPLRGEFLCPCGDRPLKASVTGRGR